MQHRLSATTAAQTESAKLFVPAHAGDAVGAELVGISVGAAVGPDVLGDAVGLEVLGDTVGAAVGAAVGVQFSHNAGQWSVSPSGTQSDGLYALQNGRSKAPWHVANGGVVGAALGAAVGPWVGGHPSGQRPGQSAWRSWSPQRSPLMNLQVSGSVTPLQLSCARAVPPKKASPQSASTAASRNPTPNNHHLRRGGGRAPPPRRATAAVPGRANRTRRTGR